MREVNSFVQLRKYSRQIIHENAKKLVVMGDCATQHLVTAICGTAVAHNVPLRVIDTDYDQIDRLTIDTLSELYTNKPDYVLMQMCTEKLHDKFRETTTKLDFADQMLNEITGYWSRISVNLQTNILMFTFLAVDDAVFGNLGVKLPESFIFQLNKLNYLLANAASEMGNVFIIDLNRIALNMGIYSFHDSKLYYTAKMPISLSGLPIVAENVIDVVKTLLGKIHKCVILDLDNTIWGGVVGDDGLEGIQIGELGLGHAFTEFQHWLKDLKNRGIILCVCSKNNEDIAKAPFVEHPEMVLRLDDISLFVANWENKADNIRSIQQELNIGMDSIVFIDDNPFERNLVRSMIPEITIPELPEDPSEYLNYLKELNLFETASYSQADKDRTMQYRSEIQRINSQKAYDSYEDYLKSLDMIATVSPFDHFQVPRIAQLTQRSNQFNLRTIRCTEDDVIRIMNDENYLTLYFMLSDKFGDHGLISLVMLKKRDQETLFIDNWLMSCRVLKRGMEDYVINNIIDIAKRNGFKTVIGEYIKSSKNAMVENIYLQYGFKKQGDTQYFIDVYSYSPVHTFIKTKEN